MGRFYQAMPVDCAHCAAKGQKNTGRAIPTVVPNAAGAPVQVNVMRCINCDVTPCQQCDRRTLKTNAKYCECGALLTPRKPR